jgi:YYY domain-containing protein
MNDFVSFAQWYSMLLVLGLLFLPVTYRLFSSLFDGGYIFAKIIGALVVSYLIFLLSTLHIIPFSIPTVIGIAVVLGVLQILLLRKTIIPFLSKHILIIGIEELIFLLTLAIWAFIRAHEPSINGLEKFMDFGFINSILRTEYFPPKDIWFAQYPINYYYFGHLVTAVLTNLSLLPSNITYNLMVATLFAFTFTGSFSIGYNALRLIQASAIKSFFTGVLSGLLVAVAGNLHTLYTFFAAYQPSDKPVPLWKLQFKPFSFLSNEYWYPNATRFIPFTIHEFPIYSFVVSDLHGHVLDIPVVLLFLLIMLSVFKENKLSLLKLIFVSFLLSVMYMTNVLDFVIYFLVLFVVTLYIEGHAIRIIYSKKPKQYFWIFSSTISQIKNLFSVFSTVVKKLVLTGFLSLMFSLPFSIHFKPFASGVGVICAPTFLTNIGKIGPILFEANHCQRSPWWMLLTLYGFFYFFVFVLLRKFFKDSPSRKKSSLIFFVLLAVVSTILIIIPEFVYIKDIYPQHYRANTMFKLTYQAFIMLSLLSAFTIGSVIRPARNFILAALTVLLLSVVLLYPRFAVLSYYNNLQNYSGLDGTAYLSTRYPDDYKAITWINTHIPDQPTLLEAQGDSYTDYERISANTGLPTVLGWTVHEWLWRGTYDVAAPRITDVQTIYTSDSSQITKQLLKKYGVSYVYIGGLEHEKYPTLTEDKFKKLGEVVYRNDSVTLYKINL